MNKFHDLNLDYLRVLNSVLTTRSATESAKRLGVTQSAISHSLKRLREILDDELVFRRGNSFDLTTRGHALRIPLQNWLDQLDGVLNIEEFDPATSTKVFYIATVDIIEHLIVPKIIKILRKSAPRIQLRFLRWEYDKIQTSLLNSQIDLAIGVRTFDSSNILQRVLYEEDFISVARKGHPILSGRATLEKFLAYPHVMTGPGDGRGAIDNYLARLNRERDLLYTVNSFASGPALVENSDCILTAPQRFIKYAEKRHRIQTFKTPLKMSPFTVKMYWAKKHHKDVANRWLRDLFYSVSE